MRDLLPKAEQEARRKMANFRRQLRRKYGPGVRFQKSRHGAGRYSIQAFVADQLVADENVS